MESTSLLDKLYQKQFAYSRDPILLLDEAGCIVALNIAWRTLFGADAAGCVGRTSVALTSRLQSRLCGELIPPAADLSRNSHSSCNDRAISSQDMRAAISECAFDSARLGRVTLTMSSVPCLDHQAGSLGGRIVCALLTDRDARKRFDTILEQRWSHELMWEQYALSYDRVLPELWFYREVVQRHCAAMSVEGIESVLDMGVGTGSVAVSLLKSGRRVTAIDIGAPMLQQLSSKLDDTIAHNIVVIEDTAERLPQCPDSSFDGVTALLTLFDMQQPHLALDEAIRVLRPGGTLVITDPNRSFNVDQLMAEAERDLRAQGLFDQLSVDWQRIQAVAPLVADTIRGIQDSASHEKQPWNTDVILQILRDRHFQELRRENSHLGNCSTIWGVKPRQSP